MQEQIPNWFGITCVVLTVGIAAFAFFGMRQGFKIKSRNSDGNPARDAIDLTNDSNRHH